MMKPLTRRLSWVAALAAIGFYPAQAAFDVRLYLDIPREPARDIEPVMEAPRFPDSPDIVDFHFSAADFFTDEGTSASTSGFLEWPQIFGGEAGGDSGFNDYGGAISGHLYVPEDGNYRFYLKSDDESALYFNPEGPEFLDPTADGVEPIAFETTCCGDWELSPSADETSVEFELEAGVGYAFEVIWSEGGGGDWVQVGWSVNGSEPTRIPAFNVQRDVRYGAANAEGITSQDGDSIPFGREGEPLTNGIGVSFEKDAEGHASTTFAWDVDAGDGFEPIEDVMSADELARISGLNSPALSISALSAAWDLYIFRPTVDGEVGPETELEVEADEEPPVLGSARGVAFPSGILVTFNEGVNMDDATDPENYEFSPAKTINGIEPQGLNSVLIDIGSYTIEELSLTVSGIRDIALAENEMEESTINVNLNPGGLLAYWKFDGESTVDAAGGIVGELEGGAGFRDETPFDGGLSLDLGSTSDGQVLRADDEKTAEMLNTAAENDDITFTYWQKLDEVANSSGFWAFSPSTGSGNRGAQAHSPWGNSQIYFDTAGCCDGATQRINASIDTFPDNTPDFFLDWHHFAFVKEGSDKSIWVDGKLFLRGDNTGELPLDFTQLTIGADPNGGNSTRGVIDDFAVFAGALLPSEIADLANQTATPENVLVGAFGPLTVVQELESINADERSDVTLTFGLEGSAPENIIYRWFRDGEEIEGESGSELNLFAELDDDGAVFQVIAANINGAFSEVTSAEATLTVGPDNDPPTLVNVTAIGGGVNTLTLEFDEELDEESALTLENYTGEGLTFESVELTSDGMGVILQSSELAVGETLVVNVANLNDASTAGNVYADAISFAPILSYVAEVLVDGPDHYWRLGDSEGAAVDVVNGNNGTYQNGVSTGQLPLVPNTRDNAAASFDGSQNQLIAVPNSGFINATNGPWPEKTIEFWFQPHSFAAPGTTGLAATQGIWEQGGGSRAIEVYTFRPEDNDNPDEAELVFHIFNNPSDGPGSPFGLNGSDATFVATPILVNESYHVVAVMDGDTEGTDGELRLYVNGELQGAAEDVGQIYNHTGDVQIGRGNALIHTGENGNLGFFDGVLDEISVYNTALSEERIQAHYSTGSTPLVLPDVLTALSPSNGAAVDTGEVTVTMIDGLGKTIDPESVSARAGGAEVDVSAVKEGDTTVVTYRPSGLLPAGATISVEVSVSYTEGGSETFELSFTTEDIPVLDGRWAVGLDEGAERGFNVRSVQWDASRANNTGAAEQQLANLDDDRIIVDTSEDDLVFDLINFNQDFDDGGGNGVFRGGSPTDEYQIADTNLGEAGLISEDNTDNFSIEATTFLAFPEAGVYTMGVNSDDGFRVTSGISNALEDSVLEIGVFSGGRGAANDSFQSTFRLMVPDAGIYAFRFITYEGGGGASAEWYSVDGDTPYLINDDEGILAYVGRTRDPEPVDDAAITSISADAGNVTIEYTGTLQSAPAVNGPYSNVDGAASPYTFTPDGNVFLRVQ